MRVAKKKSLKGKDKMNETTTSDGMEPAKVTPQKEKRQKTSKYGQKKNTEVISKNIMSKVTEAYMFTLRGGIDLIYFDSGLTEGFGIHYLNNLLFNEHEDAKTRKTKEVIKGKSGIIAVVPRRVSLQVNQAQLRIDDKGNKFKKSYFVRYSPDKASSTEEKKKCLDLLVQYMNATHYDFLSARDNSFNNKKSKTQFYVAHDFMQSNHTCPERWDTMILDEDVAQLMTMIIQPRPGKDFALEAPDMADDYYSKPYCDIAMHHFGYQNQREYS